MLIQVCVGSSCHLKGSPEIVELLAYHKLGESKKEALGFGKTEFTVPTKAEMTALCEKFVKNGINAVYKG